ncbi:prepilin-type N-terminal cleavage/methylation domain-containing protein [Candidatus Shapirobacteria bacterium]|nr:prepilin-type N-terminal cleavage/methylation domain-containing protein [Candidatus Shapirobacteria bacterium]
MIKKFKLKIKNCSGGFSLIELIVVITIIAVLSTVTLLSFGSTNKKARDSRRISDLQKVAIALEMAKQIGSTYPASNGSQPIGLVPTYLQMWPTDPKGYSFYYTSPTAYTYTLSAYVEDSANATGSYGNNCGAPGVCNYQITNP